MQKDVKVELVGNEAERTDVYRLRYSVYIDELGWTSRHADHLKGTLTDNLDASGNLFGAFRGAELVGTMRTHHSGEAGFGDYTRLYQLQDSLRTKPKSIAIATMFMVRKSMRFSRIALHLMLAALKKAIEAGIEIVFIECEPKMVSFYGKVGFATHVEMIVHPEYGTGVCMSMPIKNCPLLAKLDLESLPAAA